MDENRICFETNEIKTKWNDCSICRKSIKEECDKFNKDVKIES